MTVSHYQTESTRRSYSSLAFPLVILAVAVTVVSQFAEQDLLLIYGPLWLCVAALSLNNCGASIRIQGYSAVLSIGYLLFALFCMALYLVFNQAGYVSGLLLALTKVLLMYFVGMTLASLGLTSKQLIEIGYVYVAFAAIYAFWVQLNYIPSISSWLSSEVYLFGQKNSFGQIAGVGVIVGLMIPKKSRLMKCLLLGASAYLFFMILMAQCRTALIGCVLAVMVLIATSNKRGFLVLIVIGFLVCFATSESFRMVINHAFFLDKYSGSSMNAISSGRFDLWDDAWEVFLGNPLVGVGDYYVDNFIVNSLVNVGIFGAAMLVGLVATRLVLCIYRAFRVSKMSSSVDGRLRLMSNLCGLLSLFYVVELMFEGLPPIGPGACSFLFWIACGYCDQLYASHKASLTE